MIKNLIAAVGISGFLVGCLNSGPNQEKVAEAFKLGIPSGYSEFLSISKVESSPCVSVNSTYECSVDVTFSEKGKEASNLASYKVRVSEEDGGKIRILDRKSTSVTSLQMAVYEAKKQKFAEDFRKTFAPSGG